MIVGGIKTNPMPDLNRLRSLLDYDPLTGGFTWKVRPGNDKPTKMLNARCAGKSATPRGKGYLGLCIDQRPYMAHRIAWYYHYGEEPPELDHINMDRADNRIANLRAATRSQNIANGPARANSKSGIRGVSWDKRRKKWLACIRKDGKNACLGYFSDQQAASLAYQRAARELYGEFARAA